MKTLTWKPFFFFDGKMTLERETVCPVAFNSGFIVSHGAPRHNIMTKQESCAFSSFQSTNELKSSLENVIKG